MSAPFTFSHATHRITFGAGAVDGLGELAEAFGCRRALVLLDGFFLGGPLEARLGETLAAQRPVFHGVPQQEPDTDMLAAARAVLEEAAPDLVIAIGGGSAIDTAKVARMLVSNPGPVENIVGPAGVRMAPHPSLFVCVPTTAGTGSEVSESAVVAKAGTDYKLIFRAPELSARVALLDPELSLTAPAAVTAASGYDAITHAVEAYTSRAAGPMTDPYAVAAMEALARFLPIAYAEPDHMEARGACLIAAMQAGIAFNSAHLGLAHAISGALGALHHVPHGLANALALPWTMAYNQPALGEKGAVVARIFGGETAAEGLSQIRHAIGLDRSLDDFVDGDAARDAVAEAASKSGQVRMNPRDSTAGDLRRILEAMRAPTVGGPPDLDL
ncbi:MAG: iron-containing alcohol dehydrogenase [Alphaproteobacteria bacterium]|nr:iron-containing alcohol dehydrogenase [Alphaproteobacteria bacterium]